MVSSALDLERDLLRLIGDRVRDLLLSLDLDLRDERTGGAAFPLDLDLRLRGDLDLRGDLCRDLDLRRDLDLDLRALLLDLERDLLLDRDLDRLRPPLDLDLLLEGDLDDLSFLESEAAADMSF